MDSAEKARQTRIKTQEAQRQRYAEQSESIRVARLALQHVMSSEDATNSEILQAAELLVKLAGSW